MNDALSIEVVPGVLGVAAQAWDHLLAPDDPPFLQHRFLASLERAQTVHPDTGWIPRFALVYRGSALVAAAPAYIKLHSQGEFIFDHAWANFAQRYGIRYYPKLLIGVPFTPVTGRRLLTAPGEPRAELLTLLGQALIQVAQAFELSSVHVNFARSDEVKVLESLGYLPRLTLQYHWRRRDDQNFEDYLGRFTSKRRNQLKRELRGVADAGLRLQVVPAHAWDDTLVTTVFELYRSTVEKFTWGHQYLNRDVFADWAQNLGDTVELVAAKRGDQIIAGAINFANNRSLYGRYWGAFEEVRYLHFAVCYYFGIEEAFRRGLDTFEPGAGGEHKLVRGFEPTLMHSAHYLADPRLYEPIQRHLITERQAVLQEAEQLQEVMGERKT